MTWIPSVPFPPPIKPFDPFEEFEQIRVALSPTLTGCTDAQLEAERQRRDERREQQLKDAIKLVEGAGYSVVKGSGG